ncbi:hypothetical protein PgNI_05523 [Pyricularia grisea]|uniref:Autophagy-related protein 27 n=1 Tax=Pyricularia grisea TaxID=148305 RepID=A0A6P8B6G2_PYRGI|nr:hypothetical protein PgNI_05523 [Pyricularia grisea]TLD10850.1 hypothetical protein PgNI_05523 [Pyricularia grisea]
MQLSSPIRRRTPTTILSLLMLLPGISTAAKLECDKIATDGFTFNLEALKGPHTVITSVQHGTRFTNVTYSLDLCGPLKKKDDVKKEDACPEGSWVCAISHNIDTASKTDSIIEIRPIAGDVDGATLDPVATRLSTSSADGDKDKVGVRLVLQGGHYNGRKQKAVVEVLCDDKLEGTEGEWKSDELGIPTPPSVKAAEDGKDKDDAPHQLKKDGAALIWDSYGPSEEDPKNMDVLKLTWKTKHACEKRSEGGSGGGDKGGSGGRGGSGDGDKDKGGQDESKHWGFFTWMIILVFLGVAAYLIFGSWLNYNRYGARGWDLLPHGDTIRDVPYLMQDWIRRVVQTLQGGGSRGGYSAV